MIDLRAQKVLIARQRVLIPQGPGQALGRDALATILSNMSYYGYALSLRAYEQLERCPGQLVAAWWEDVELVLASLTGEDRGMGEHVVYKNFPAQVLAMSEAEYWIRQILMYWGLPNALFTEAAAPRAALGEPVTLRVLHPAQEGDLQAAFEALLRATTRWSGDQWEEARYLALTLAQGVALSSIPLKENMIKLALFLMAHGLDAQVATATDALRLAAVMSGGSPRLSSPTRLRAFTRAERRFLLGCMEHATHLEADLGQRPEPFKRLMRALHPGDYKARYPRVVAAADALYRDALPDGYSSQLEAALRAGDEDASLALLSRRPGEFARRLHMALLRFGLSAANAFVQVMPALDTARLVSLCRYLETVNSRQFRLFPPKGSWIKVRVFKDGQLHTLPRQGRSAAQDRARRALQHACAKDKKRVKALKRQLLTLQRQRVAPSSPAVGADARRIGSDCLGLVCQALRRQIAARAGQLAPSVALDERTRWIKLPDQDAELLPYGRGTRFPIPDQVTFLRSASYWAAGQATGHVWFDNGWCFFDEAWAPKGVCCWDHTHEVRGAVFSGDPTSGKDMAGRACQLIDLTLEALREQGVRYAVWNILAYSRRCFDDVPEVFAALQWGEQAQQGELFEPSRCQLAFALKGKALTKYIAYVDLVSRDLVYLDATLRGDVSSAHKSLKPLQRVMPALCERLDAAPSVYDLFRDVPKDRRLGVPVRYDDAAHAPRGGQLAYVFKSVHQGADYEPMALQTLLASRGLRRAP